MEALGRLHELLMMAAVVLAAQVSKSQSPADAALAEGATKLISSTAMMWQGLDCAHEVLSELRTSCATDATWTHVITRVRSAASLLYLRAIASTRSVPDSSLGIGT